MEDRFPRKLAAILYADVHGYSHLSRLDEAQVEIASARAINPKLTIAFIKNLFAIANNHPDNRAAWLSSLEKAGMPPQ